jgi:hypothetical protein
MKGVSHHSRPGMQNIYTPEISEVLVGGLVWKPQFFFLPNLIIEEALSTKSYTWHKGFCFI